MRDTIAMPAASNDRRATGFDVAVVMAVTKTATALEKEQDRPVKVEPDEAHHPQVRHEERNVPGEDDDEVLKQSVVPCLPQEHELLWENKRAVGVREVKHFAVGAVKVLLETFVAAAVEDGEVDEGGDQHHATIGAGHNTTTGAPNGWNNSWEFECGRVGHAYFVKNYHLKCIHEGRKFRQYSQLSRPRVDVVPFVVNHTHFLLKSSKIIVLCPPTTEAIKCK